MDHEDLLAAISAYLRTFQRLYGPDIMTPKFHYLLHLPHLLQRHSWLPSCWVHERKHKSAKAYGNHVQNVSADWHVGVLRDMSSAHMANLCEARPEHFGAQPYLLEPRPAKPKLQLALQREFPKAVPASIVTARRARSLFGHVAHGDIVLFHSAASPVIGRVAMLCAFEDAHGAYDSFVTLEKWAMHSEESHAWKCIADTSMFVACPLSELEFALIVGGSDLKTVVKPTV